MTTRPSGSTATALTAPVAAELDRAGARLRRVPHQHAAAASAAEAAAGDHPPVRQHRHRPHPALVAAKLKDQGRACPPRGPLEHRARIAGGKLPGPEVGGEEGFAEFGRLQAQLARHEPGIAGRFLAAQVVSLAAYHGVHGRQPQFAGGRGAARFKLGQHRVDTEGPDGGGDPAGVAGQCGQPRRILGQRGRVGVQQVARCPLSGAVQGRPTSSPPAVGPLMNPAKVIRVTQILVFLRLLKQGPVGELIAVTLGQADGLQADRRSRLRGSYLRRSHGRIGP